MMIYVPLGISSRFSYVPDAYLDLLGTYTETPSLVPPPVFSQKALAPLPISKPTIVTLL